MIALAAGTALTIAALLYVLYPLFRNPENVSRGPLPSAVDRAATSESDSQIAIEALREIEFDRATGKLSEGDYASLKERYTSDAISAMRVEEGAASDPITVDAVEALVNRFRAKPSSCGNCGPRPESDAAYCSSCGLFLGAACSRCSAPVTEPGAKFCSSCGAVLAA